MPVVTPSDAGHGRLRRWLRSVGQFAAAASPAWRPLLDPADSAALIALARGADAPASRPVAARGAGDRLSLFIGRGLDYAESRAYQPGDDLRDLHWRLLARTGRPYVRQHREEHVATWHLLLDLRPHMAFGTRLRTKAEQAARAGLLAAAVQALRGDGMRLGLTCWNDAPQSVELGRGAGAVQRLAQQLAAHRVAPLPSGATRCCGGADEAFGRWALRLARTLPQGAQVVLVGDAAGWDAPEADAALWALQARATVRLLLVRDPVEAALPAAAALAGAELFDLAADRAAVLDPAMIARFAARADAQQSARLAHWRARGLDCVAAGVDRSDADLLRALRSAG
jgi:uncharacterized protein (DUF58 family)